MALTGATGFIGSAVVRHLSAAAETAVLVREAGRVDAPARTVQGTLDDRGALEDLCAGAQILVHAASYVGDDPTLQQSVNVEGTARVVEVARRAGVRRIVHLSTAGVYGGDLNGRAENERPERPRSALSSSRLLAERYVLDAGGTVLRPHLVHGRGDRWFLAPLIAAVRRLGAWVGNPDAPLSCIGRDRLGALVARTAVDDLAAGVYHVAEPRPTSVRSLAGPVFAHAGTETPTCALGAGEAAIALAPLGITRAQIDLVAHDSWFSTTKLWTASPPAVRLSLPAQRVPEDVDWYASALADPHPARN
ncbi:NAD-dependent epimerase/dehydratase family protein [Isoptericola aurantiacus]|uniref:NAD-dependent epimerase/dehydratase family protein n=1 Tax=Isoptericola aurantiacus TaxID=3377839 RepID=UPI00383BCA1B